MEDNYKKNFGFWERLWFRGLVKRAEKADISLEDLTKEPEAVNDLVALEEKSIATSRGKGLCELITVGVGSAAAFAFIELANKSEWIYRHIPERHFPAHGETHHWVGGEYGHMHTSPAQEAYTLPAEDILMKQNYVNTDIIKAGLVVFAASIALVYAKHRWENYCEKMNTSDKIKAMAKAKFKPTSQ